MVQQFKLRQGKHPCYPIEATGVETHIGRQEPWFVRGTPDRHYALCPYCDNPIQLKALYNRGPNSPQPYGSHLGHAIEGFSYNDTTQKNCPYIVQDGSSSRGGQRPLDDFARDLIDYAFSEFDRIILILRDDLGFRFSDAFALRLLESWITSEGYRYPGAHLRNLPWMILYFGGSANLYGQLLDISDPLTEAILRSVTTATLDRRSRLTSEGTFFRVEMQALNHQSKIEGDEVSETLDVRIMNYTNSKSADDAEEIYRFAVSFKPERVEGLIHTPSERAKRDKRLLKLADKARQKLSLPS